MKIIEFVFWMVIAAFILIGLALLASIIGAFITGLL